MKVLLLDIGTPRNEISEPIGIETIAAYVVAEHPDVDLHVYSLELCGKVEIEDILRDQSFDIIGISTKIRSFDRLLEAISASLHHNGKTILVLGDIMATFAFPQLLRIAERIICVRGEGEDAMPRIIEHYKKHPLNFMDTLEDIPNLAYLKEGKVIKTRRALVNVATARHPKRIFLHDVSAQYGIAHLEGSRGCTYADCSFCGINEKYSNGKWRPFTLEFILKELEILSAAKFKSPYFTDEDFFGNDIGRVYDFANLVIQAKKTGRLNPDMNFYFNARATSILGEGYGGVKESVKLLRLLKHAGLREVFIGVESGCNEQLNRYTKYSTAKKNITAIQILKEVGIALDTGFILFDPTATIKNIRANINFLYESGLNSNYSRLVKKLRLQPFTAITDKYLLSHPTSQINLDLVTYDYTFQSEEVADVYHRFSVWENDDLDIIYNMQSFCRGEVASEQERMEVSKIISCYRALDIEFLSSVLDVYEDKKSTKIDLVRTTDRYKRIRDIFDSNLIDRMKWYDSSYRRKYPIV